MSSHRAIPVLIIALLSLDLVAAPLRYRTELSPVEDEALHAALVASSRLIALEDAAEPPSALGLVRRARSDWARLWKVLRAFGFYAGEVHIRIGEVPLTAEDLISRVEGAGEQGLVLVTITVENGPRFTIGDVALRDAATGAPSPEIDPATLDLRPGDPALAAEVIAAEQRVIKGLRDAGHPFAEVAERRIIVDHATREMDVTLLLAPGPRARLGAVTIDGLKAMDAPFVRRRLDPGPDALYSPGLLRDMRDRLADLNVFARIRVSTADSLDAEGRLPVFVELTERPQRVVGIGAELSTAEGLGASASWRHRNLFGRAERLRLHAEVGRVGVNPPDDIDYGLGLRYGVPDFLARDQELVAELALVREHPDAFRREAVEALMGIERRQSERLDLSIGLRAEISELDDAVGPTGRLRFLSLPLGLQLDTTDDPLDPTRGARLALQVTPYTGDRDLVRGSLAGAGYLRLPVSGEPVLALRARLGATVGTELSELPADKRFYAGGGGSVRGYRYQSIGPSTPSDNPLGGLSLIELGAELRLRLNDQVGLVPFIDAGQVFDDALPRLDEPLRLGAGLGLRYFTGIGPLRLDVAVPIDKRPRDDSFQLYLSIGQAF